MEKNFIENGMLERVYHYLSQKKLHTFLRLELKNKAGIDEEVGAKF